MSAEKNEKPTDKKIRDARDKGQIAVSRDLSKLAMLLVVMEIALGAERLWRDAIDSLMEIAVSGVGRPFAAASAELFSAAGQLLLVVFFLFFLVCSVVAVFANWGQFGVLIAPEAITPKFDKLNPASGLAQLFSKKKLGELLLAVFKATLIGWLSFILVRDQLPAIVQFAGGEPKDIYFGFIALTRSIFHVLVALFLVLGLIDFAMQKYFHSKSLNMDMEEIKREYREMEGDPLVKGMRKRLGREWAMEGPVNQTKGANAVVVNPTHFAVAMLYNEETPVPLVLARGKDETAQAMIQAARDCGIPVIRHVWLARTLYATCGPDDVIPRSSYESVAYVYAVVNELRLSNQIDRVVELESRGEPPHAENL
ncbi:type III secretion system export apparatus subunit SctU [Collimonas humicola]|uniref:type III secretion system export apparatus subunit SctU n=1 Tax=Collimonas humicola TaxID=2825886 RepID=UPI001B8D6960|nr:type III secretion system export apparatus subunit SctU [Collimonas humicola]